MVVMLSQLAKAAPLIVSTPGENVTVSKLVQYAAMCGTVFKPPETVIDVR